MQDHYASLGVSPGASAETIKAAYRKQAALYHPDKNAAPDAATRFRSVQTAYEVLGDPAQRQAYDENRRRNLIEEPLPVAREIAGQYLKDALR